jgi:HEAT repeat protein
VSQPQSSNHVSPLASVYPLVERYQQHVHHLENGVLPSRLQERESNLLPGIPEDLKHFLLQHNGAIFFDGDLIVHSTMALTPVDGAYPNVVCFAQMNVQVNPIQIDGVETEVWAYGIDQRGDGCYGLWNNETFTPLYRDFYNWLESNIRLLDEGTFPNIWVRRRQMATHAIFFEAMAIEDLIEQGLFQEAEQILGALLQEHVTPKLWWQYAECLRILNRAGWQQALLEAVRCIRFPLAYGNTLPEMSDWIQSIVDLVPHSRALLLEACEMVWNNEVLTLPEGCIVSRADMSLIESLALYIWNETHPIDRVDLAQEWQAVIARLDSNYVPTRLIVSVIDHCIQISGHDEAESMIFALQRRASELETDLLLRLARIVVRRHEPWGLHILFDILETDVSLEVQREVWLLAAQYCIDNDSLTQAEQFLDTAESLLSFEQPDSLVVYYWLLQGLHAFHSNLLGPAGKCIVRCKEVQVWTDPWLTGHIARLEGHIAVIRGQNDKATRAFQDAMESFSSIHARLEMAETLLDWGRTSSEMAYIQTARTIFQSIGFASGVSVADRLLQQPDQSWGWYIDTAKHLVQRQVHLRRASTKGIRQEADCPERRLYGLQMAVSDSDVEIVDRLSVLAYQAREIIEQDKVSTAHEQYAVFASSLVLLLAHSSIEACDVVVDLVRSTQMHTVAHEALVTQLSRTRNDRMIACLKSMVVPSESPSALCIVVDVLGQRRETDSISNILNVLNATDDSFVQSICLLTIGRMGDTSMLSQIEVYGQRAKHPEYWALALLLLGDHSSIDILSNQMQKGLLGEHTRLGHLIGRYGGSEHILLLKQLAHANLPVSLSAIHGLGYIGHTLAIPMLLEMTGLKDRSVAIAASHALELITGHHENTEDYLLRARWQTWLDTHDHFVRGVRYRKGEPMSPAILIDALSHDERIVRMSAYDELVIMTGVQLPFDVDGVWRVQKEQIYAWMDWWSRHRETFPVGQWVYQGSLIQG